MRFWPAIGTAVLTGIVASVALAAPSEKLKNPASLTETAPATFLANFETTKGLVVIEVHRDWAPNGADRFFNLVKNGYYDDCKFFRVLPGFMAQFGINGDPALNAAWRGARIPDDPVKQSNTRGMVTFATGGPGTRTTQLFINFVDRNAFLDSQGFSPFGKVIKGMDVVDKINSETGERPDQGRIQMEGNAYLTKEFPNLDTIKRAWIDAPAAKKAEPADPKAKK